MSEGLFEEIGSDEPEETIEDKFLNKWEVSIGKFVKPKHMFCVDKENILGRIESIMTLDVVVIEFMPSEGEQYGVKEIYHMENLLDYDDKISWSKIKK